MLKIGDKITFPRGKGNAEGEEKVWTVLDFLPYLGNDESVLCVLVYSSNAKKRSAKIDYNGDYGLPDFERIKRNALSASVGSCTCMTKTPDLFYHKPGCRYRKLMEAYNRADTSIVNG